MQGISVDELERGVRESLREWTDEPLVELEREHTGESREERRGESTSTRADFDHPRRKLVELRHDALGDSSIDEKILTETRSP